MSAAKPTTVRPKTGSAFKVPGSRTASTPLIRNDKNGSLACNVSVVPPTSTSNQKVKQRQTPGTKASTPTKDEKDITLGCDISAIQPGNGVSQRANPMAASTAKKALYKSGLETSVQVPSNKMTKQMELDMAYNTYLLAVTHNTIQEKHYADTKSQIEADLGALAKRLAVNQLNLENTKQRIANISFLSERDGLLSAQKEAMLETLDHMDGATVQRISDISAAVGKKTENLEMRNVQTGTAELKRILADSNRILSQLRGSTRADVGDKTLTAANHLKNAAATAGLVNTRQERVAKMLPAYQGAPLTEHAIITFEAQQREQERRRLEEEEEEEEEDDLDGPTSDMPDGYSREI